MNENAAVKNFQRLLALLSLGFAYGIIYLLPYMKSTFYDQMLAATGFTNEQMGQMMSVYGLMCTLSYLPGGWIADRIKPRTLLSVCSIINGLLCFVFLIFHTNFAVSLMVWGGCALTGGFAFWPSMLKGVRLLGKKEEQGRIYGVFEGVNGLTSMFATFIATFVSTRFADMIAGFNGIVVTMGVTGLFSGILIWVFFNEHITYNEEALAENEKIRLKDFLQVIVMPRAWIPSLLLFCGITMYAGMGYLNPYMTDKVGIAVALASILSGIREYGCRIGGIGGGFMADKVFKSSAKWQVAAHILTTALILSFLVVPADAPVLVVLLTLLFGLAVYANRVTTYSLVTEFKISTKVGATTIALMTLVGYTPDMFVHTLFGNWLDVYGSDGYRYIFIYLGCIGAAGVLLALLSVLMSKKINAAGQAA
jgi:MFS family permease